ncbi:MAG: putative metal-binding motif-containing protein [Hyalangium sp.]|uniref:putative metal-binding motif-containing protein n=1 Tax=Hyalangium sp. TaxID=2028555 RepID=UPI003899F498
MSNPSFRLASLGLLFAGLGLALSGACYESPKPQGYFTCSEDSECGDGGLVCDDGVCCSERGEPLCLGRVLDGGVCADGGTATRYFRDEDGDGFGNLTQPLLRCAPPESIRVVTNSDDCNDNPAAGGDLFFPGAPEQCDGLDNNCNGQFDEGFDGGTYYFDEDNDGYGDTKQPRVLCKPSQGWVALPNDCQPLNPRIHPNAVEECNGMDDDCNGYIDEGVTTTWYRDGDGDGYGRADMQQQACVQPSGYVINKDDCDDSNAAKNPDALDVCDGTDNNCRNGIDERPDCGGPADLLDLKATGERGAVDTQTSFSGVTQGCLRYWDGGVPESFSANNVWSGSRPQSHVVWFQAPQSWDLSRATNSLAIHFDPTMSGIGNPPWAPHKQPIVLLCSPTGYARYVPVMDGGTTPLMPTAGGQVTTTLPIGQGSAGGWVERNTALDLKHVQRVEIMVEPNDGGSPTLPVSFDIQFLKLGFQ